MRGQGGAPAPGNASLLTLSDVSIPARLLSITQRVSPGDMVHVIGPNGAGKSSLLAAMSGLLPVTGHIMLAGRTLSAWSGGELALYRGYLCQQASPDAIMPVFQYLMLHQPRGAAESAIDDAIGLLAKALALDDKLDRLLSRLSGGEWQRVRLAAVLLQVWPSVNPQARLLLLDEPSSSLDIAQRVALDGLLAQLTRAGIAVVLCAHDLNHTLHHAGMVWLMAAGQLAAAGDAADIMQPQKLSPVFGVEFTLLRSGAVAWLAANASAGGAITTANGLGNTESHV